MIKNINHVAIMVSDVERSKKFYENVLKLKKIPRPKTTVPGEWLGIGDNQLHLVGERVPRERSTRGALTWHWRLRISRRPRQL